MEPFPRTTDTATRSHRQMTSLPLGIAPNLRFDVLKGACDEDRNGSRHPVSVLANLKGGTNLFHRHLAWNCTVLDAEKLLQALFDEQCVVSFVESAQQFCLLAADDRMDFVLH